MTDTHILKLKCSTPIGAQTTLIHDVPLSRSYKVRAEVSGKNHQEIARLFAAAPELLKALESITSEAINSVEYSDWPELQEAVSNAATAIANARNGL